MGTALYLLARELFSAVSTWEVTKFTWAERISFWVLRTLHRPLMSGDSAWKMACEVVRFLDQFQCVFNRLPHRQAFFSFQSASLISFSCHFPPVISLVVDKTKNNFWFKCFISVLKGETFSHGIYHLTLRSLNPLWNSQFVIGWGWWPSLRVSTFQWVSEASGCIEWVAWFLVPIRLYRK